jgi:hypothetical protein
MRKQARGAAPAGACVPGFALTLGYGPELP